MSFSCSAIVFHRFHRFFITINCLWQSNVQLQQIVQHAQHDRKRFATINNMHKQRMNLFNFEGNRANCLATGSTTVLCGAIYGSGKEFFALLIEMERNLYRWKWLGENFSKYKKKNKWNMQ